MLKKKCALVTGSTRGIGQAIAGALAAEGASVMLNGFGEAGEIERARAELAERAGVTVDYFDADLTKADHVGALIGATVERLGGLDIVVNCAGIQIIGALDGFAPEDWDTIIALNLSAVFHTTRLAIPHMKARGWGRIVNIASTHGLVASPFKVPYVASKHGLVGLTKGTALEVAAFGITCNAICPGFTKTPMFDVQAEGLAATTGVPVDEVIREQVGAKQAIAEVIEPGEIAAAVVFLCSEKARSITGTALPVDGGWTAG